MIASGTFARRANLIPFLLGTLLMITSVRLASAWEVVALKGGETVEGVVVNETEQELTVNVYFSSIREMSYELRVIQKKLIANRQTRERPFETYLAKAAAVKGGDADAHAALATWCKEQKLSYEMDEELKAALDIQPDHKEARAAFGEAKADKYLADRKTENDVIHPLELKYTAAGSDDERKTIFEELKKQGYKKPQCWLDRIARSLKQPKGLREDVPLTYRADKVSGGLYTIFVPEAYDPWKPCPLVMGLHGGGAAGKAGEFVNGDGKQTMPFYQQLAAQRGWIVICPNALKAPWRETPNEDLIEACLKEMELMYNVDVNRVYLVGHSMGGYGCWHFGPKWCERFAAISPNSGGASNGFGNLAKTLTPVYIYHGADDGVCQVGDSRNAAQSLKKAGADFIYTELPNSGHAFPPNIVEDIFRFFDLKRLGVPAGGGKSAPFVKSQGVRSSFLQELGLEETKYLSPLGAAEGSGTVKSLVTQLSLGGRNGEEAAKNLVKLGDKSALKPVCQVLLKGTIAEARKSAADVLAEMGDKTVVQAPCTALGDDDLSVRAAAARALGKIGETKALPALLQALQVQAKELDSKKVGNRMEDADWQKQLGVLEQITWALGKLGAGDKRAAGAVVDACANKILLADIAVEHDRMSSYEDPKAVSERFCLAVIEALGDIGQASATDAVKKLMAKFKDSSGIQTAGEEALKKLAAAPEQK